MPNSPGVPAHQTLDLARLSLKPRPAVLFVSVSTYWIWTSECVSHICQLINRTIKNNHVLVQNGIKLSLALCWEATSIWLCPVSMHRLKGYLTATLLTQNDSGDLGPHKRFYYLKEKVAAPEGGGERAGGQEAASWCLLLWRIHLACCLGAGSGCLEIRRGKPRHNSHQLMCLGPWGKWRINYYILTQTPSHPFGLHTHPLELDSSTLLEHYVKH